MSRPTPKTPLASRSPQALAFGLLALLTTAAAAFSPAGPAPIDVPWFTVDAGGGRSTGGLLVLEGTVGQPDAGPELTGGTLSLVGGYRATPAPVQTPCPGDVNGDGSVDVQDLTAVILAWGDCPAPCQADIDGNDAVDVSDLVTLISAWGTCP